MAFPLRRIKNIVHRLKRTIKLCFDYWFCIPIIEGVYGGFWNYRSRLIRKGKTATGIYNAYLEMHCASISLKTQFAETPTLPHGLHGIHISAGAVVGKGVTIFQNVTIGSNTLPDSKRNGCPTIGNNVFIGANASVIGRVTVGDNCRIAANCCVYLDIADNQTITSGKVTCIPHKSVKDNRFLYIDEYNKLVEEK